jgi:hypothetical protein
VAAAPVRLDAQGPSAIADRACGVGVFQASEADLDRISTHVRAAPASRNATTPAVDAATIRP